MGLPKNSGIDIRCKYEKGNRNLITDVPGIKVGHVTLIDEGKGIHTGVTAILPHSENIFQKKVMAATSVINGFGKSAGLIQIDELGTIESPIIMTNTFGVGTALNAVTKYMLEVNEDIGNTTGTVNCVVTECNDSELNDIRGMHINEEDVIGAIRNCSDIFEEGGVGAGTGMVCMGIKGGIGSASRIVNCDNHNYTIGAILMSNYGVSGNLMIDGKRVDTRNIPESESEKGSVIIVLGTDLPLNERQLRRVAKRATVALARTGSYLGNGSGDIAISFSTSNIVPHYSEKDIIETKMFHDGAMDKIFEATAEVVEEAVISSLYHGEYVKGIRGKEVYGLHEYL
ncbi:MAG: P1 family peptidase [Tissierellia bacterium]|nr:P1 family peptidase [Tissierellia bacterium]